MAEVTKIKGGIILECDCGATHKITSNSGELKTKSTYKKQENKADEKTEQKPEQKPEPKSEQKSESDDGGLFS